MMRTLDYLRPREWDLERWNGWRLCGCTLYYPAAGSRSAHLSIRTYRSISSRRAPRPETLGVITRVVGMRDRHGDPWASDECLAGLLRALNDIVRPGSTLDGAMRD